MFDQLTFSEAVALDMMLDRAADSADRARAATWRAMRSVCTPTDKLRLVKMDNAFRAMRHEFDGLHFNLMDRRA
jgi:hypothetical protein